MGASDNRNAAELILDGSAKLVDASSLNPGRFVRSELLQGEYSYGHIWHNNYFGTG